ncbi:MAG: DUF2478 domain-containing protein [Deltaproteobacteria bacterium]|nr:DUF2478 domain-containing protein [Deltaproteobacteria bacterium]
MVARWALIVGERADGRSAIATRVAEQLTARGFRVGGFVEEPFEREGTKLGWDLVRISDGERRELARVAAEPNLCGYFFREEVFAEARRELGRDTDVAMLTAGKLEAQGQGHWPAIAEAMDTQLAVLMIRPYLLSRFALDLPEPVASIELPASFSAIDEFVEKIERTLRPPA